MPCTPWVSDDFDLTLDHQSVIQSIENMTFLQMKRKQLQLNIIDFIYKFGYFLLFLTRIFLAAPGPPIIIPEECTSENNSITIAWQPHPSSFVEGYILELDDGNNGSFRVCRNIFIYCYFN